MDKLRPLDIFKLPKEVEVPEWFDKFLNHYSDLTQVLINFKKQGIEIRSVELMHGVAVTIPITKQVVGVLNIDGRVDFIQKIEVGRSEIKVTANLPVGYCVHDTWDTKKLTIRGPLSECISRGDRVTFQNGTSADIISVTRKGKVVEITTTRQGGKVNKDNAIFLERAKASLILFS